MSGHTASPVSVCHPLLLHARSIAINVLLIWCTIGTAIGELRDLQHTGLHVRWCLLQSHLPSLMLAAAAAERLVVTCGTQNLKCPSRLHCAYPYAELNRSRWSAKAALRGPSHRLQLRRSRKQSVGGLMEVSGISDIERSASAAAAAAKPTADRAEPTTHTLPEFEQVNPLPGQATTSHAVIKFVHTSSYLVRRPEVEFLRQTNSLAATCRLH